LARSHDIKDRHFPELSANALRKPGLSIVVLNLNRPDLLGALWEAFNDVLHEGLGLDTSVELLVGDTGSTDPETLWLLDNQPAETRIFRKLKYNFSVCNNYLFRFARYDTILFLNNDVLIHENPKSIRLAYECLHTGPFSIVGAVLCFADGLIQHIGVDFFRTPELYGFCYHPAIRTSWTHQLGRSWEIPAVTGAFLMMSVRDFISVGGFDEAYEAECQDVDLCLKLRRLRKSIGIIDPGRLTHLENATRSIGDENQRDRQTFMRRWNSFVEML
jgi:GT2 family glycosyltransferase